MANKELTFGCKVKFSKWVYKIIDRENIWFLSSYEAKDWVVHNTIVIEDGVNSRCYNIEKIIWHPVMIGDVLDWIENKDFDTNKKIPWFWFDNEEGIDDESKLFLIQDYYTGKIIAFWNKKRGSIEAQSDECIDYVYSLIQKS